MRAGGLLARRRRRFRVPSPSTALATVGNVIGGAIFVAGVYWIGSPKAREQAAQERAVTAEPSLNGTVELEPVAASR